MSDSEPISLDELAQAFAQAMGGPARTPADGQTEAASSDSEAAAAGDITAATVERLIGGPDDAGPVTPLSILEAMLFVGERGKGAISGERAAELMRGVEPGEVAELVHELNRRYAREGCPYYVAADADGYRMTLRKEFHALRQRLSGQIREARLSQAAIDIMAIVAYQQPLTGEQIGAVRGKPSGHVLTQLVHRRLLRIERLPGKRRTVQYFTTDRFLELFGLHTLADLPQSEELERQ